MPASLIIRNPLLWKNVRSGSDKINAKTCQGLRIKVHIYIINFKRVQQKLSDGQLPHCELRNPGILQLKSCHKNEISSPLTKGQARAWAGLHMKQWPCIAMRWSASWPSCYLLLDAVCNAIWRREIYRRRRGAGDVKRRFASNDRHMWICCCFGTR